MRKIDGDLDAALSHELVLTRDRIDDEVRAGCAGELDDLAHGEGEGQASRTPADDIPPGGSTSHYVGLVRKPHHRGEPVLGRRGGLEG